jgi:hypothetical protein
MAKEILLFNSGFFLIAYRKVSVLLSFAKFRFVNPETSAGCLLNTEAQLGTTC